MEHKLFAAQKAAKKFLFHVAGKFSRLRSMILKNQAQDMVSQTRRTTAPNPSSLKFHHIVCSPFFSAHYSRIKEKKKASNCPSACRFCDVHGFARGVVLTELL